MDVVHDGLARAGLRALNKDVTLAPVEERQEIGYVVGGHDKGSLAGRRVAHVR